MVHVVRAVYGPIVLALSISIDREADDVHRTLRVGSADIYLIGGVAGYTRLESDKLLIIAVIQRQLADLCSADEPFHGHILEIDLKRFSFYGDGFRHRAGLKSGVNRQPVADIEFDIVLDELLESLDFHRNRVAANRQKPIHLLS